MIPSSVASRLSWHVPAPDTITRAHSRADALNARRELAKKRSSEAILESADIECEPSSRSVVSGRDSDGSNYASNAESLELIQQNIQAVEASFEANFQTFQTELQLGLEKQLLPLHRKLDMLAAGRCFIGRAQRGASFGYVQPPSDFSGAKLRPDWEGGQLGYGPKDEPNPSDSRFSVSIAESPVDLGAYQLDMSSNSMGLNVVRKTFSNQSTSDNTGAKSGNPSAAEDSMISFPVRQTSPDSPCGSLRVRKISSHLESSLSSPAATVYSVSRAGRAGLWSTKLSNFNKQLDANGLGWSRRLFMPSLIVCSVLIPLMEASEILNLPPHLRCGLEMSLDCIFMIELLFRYMLAPNWMLYVKSIWTWIDAIACLPLVLRIHSLQDGSFMWRNRPTGFNEEFLISVAPALRLLKLLRRFEKFHLLLRAFIVAFEALPVLVFTMSSFVLTFASLIFMCEGREKFGTLPKAMWFTIVSMTTVGYGDIVPDTSAGHVITAILLWMSALYMAIPIGIVGNAFHTVWTDRDRLLLVQRTRDRLLQVGLNPEDILDFFYVFDANKDGVLSLQEFQTMMKQLDLGFSEDRTISLFHVIDGDMSGSIDDKEFVRNLFPGSFGSIYGAPSADPMAM